MNSKPFPDDRFPEPAAILSRYLREGEDTIRCAAARAMASVGDVAAAPALVEALLDEDPDVRADAMTALFRCARPEDVGAIRHSLMGDPVKEVKTAAIEALARLEDIASVPLLRSLAKSRCEQDVGWEDETGMWDDWLDVQLAAIAALGRMARADAIEDFLAARSDEMGQELDPDVFEALSRISDGGIAVLIDFLHDENGKVRRQALRALANAHPDLLAPLSDKLVADANPEVRRIAIATLDPNSRAASKLALSDPDNGVRRAAMARFASARPDIAREALSDEDEETRAIALEAIFACECPKIDEDLVANIQVWMTMAGGRLSATCADLYLKMPGIESGDHLIALATDSERPLEARIAAIRSLGAGGAVEVLEALANLVLDPVRQIRMTALAAIAELAKNAPGTDRHLAESLLVRAIDGDLMEASPTDEIEAGPENDHPGASKAEEGGARRIVISPDGDIVDAAAKPDAGDNPDLAGEAAAKQFPTSTLDSIQTVPPVPSDRGSEEKSGVEAPEDGTSLDDRAGDDENFKKGRRRRVAVDGPDDIASDIPLIALRIVADCPGDAIENAIVRIVSGTDRDRRAAACEALAIRAENGTRSTVALEILVDALADPDPMVRGPAARAIAASLPEAAEHLAGFLDDEDAMVRAVAYRAVANWTPERAIDGLRDESGLVRAAIMEAILASGDDGLLEDGVRICLEAGWSDSLAGVAKQTGAVQNKLFHVLALETLNRTQTQCALEALAASAAPTASV